MIITTNERNTQEVDLPKTDRLMTMFFFLADCEEGNAKIFRYNAPSFRRLRVFPYHSFIPVFYLLQYRSIYCDVHDLYLYCRYNYTNINPIIVIVVLVSLLGAFFSSLFLVVVMWNPFPPVTLGLEARADENLRQLCF